MRERDDAGRFKSPADPWNARCHRCHHSAALHKSRTDECMTADCTCKEFVDRPPRQERGGLGRLG